MKIKAIATLSLVFSFIMAASGCGVQSEITDTTTFTGSEVTSTENAVTTTEAPDLPETNMNGKTFTFFTERWDNYAPIDIDDLTAEEINGEILNDRAYERQKNIEERFNCVIEQLSYNNSDFNQLLNAISAGEDAYQIALFRATHFNKLLTSGYLSALDTIPYLDLEADWYDTNSFETLRVLGRNLGIVSDITMTTNKMVGCTYFNQNMAEDYGIGDIYDLVDTGKWTWDALYSFGQLAASDLNNDGKFTIDDRFGFSYINDIPVCLLQSGGVTFATLDKDGIPTITFAEESNISKMEKLWNILADTATSYNVHQRSVNYNRDEVGIFIDGHALFTLAGIYYAPQFRDMKDDFGIIPLPKYDEEQDSYRSPVFTSTFIITGVPVTNNDPENTGMIIEELAYEGYRDIRPAFYDVTLQGKITRDDTSNRMLDLIFSSTCYDPGLAYDFGNINSTMAEHISKLTGNFASSFASIKDKAQTNIDKMIEEIESTQN